MPDPYEGHRHEQPCAWCHEPWTLCVCDHVLSRTTPTDESVAVVPDSA